MECDLDICILCPGEPQPILEDTVKEEGLTKIRSISRLSRQDNKFRLLPASFKEKNFHLKCYKKYISPKNISKKSNEQEENNPPSPRKTRLSTHSVKDKNSASSQASTCVCVNEPVSENDEYEFDFQKLCIFYESDASES